MQTEIEAKALSVNHDTLRVKLRELGATLVHPQRLMRRYNLDFPDGRLGKDPEGSGWVRVRDEADKITMSYKQLSDRTLHGTKEVNIVVDDFDKAFEFLKRLGLVSKTYQETTRESWRLGDLEIELDQWPWTKPYIEIEGPNEAALRDIFATLGLDWQTAVFGSVEVVYQAEYDISDEELYSLGTFTFDLALPEFLKSRRKQS